MAVSFNEIVFRRGRPVWGVTAERSRGVPPVETGSRSMPTKSRRVKSSNPPTEVVRAAEAVRRALGRLVQLLDTDDASQVYAAGSALANLGGQAVVGPLAAALARSSSPRHRAYLVAALESFGPQEEPRVLRALLQAQKREQDPSVAFVIRGAVVRLILKDPNLPRDATLGARTPDPLDD
jgi:HEAT repeat protein